MSSGRRVFGRVAVTALALAAVQIPVAQGQGSEPETQFENASPRPKVYPVRGSEKASFVIAFEAGKAAGDDGRVDRYYTMDLAGPGRCDRLRGRTKRTIEHGDTVQFRVGGFRVPNRVRPGWCRGTYRGIVRWKRLDRKRDCEDGGSGCEPSTRRIGRFSFRVRNGLAPIDAEG